MNKKELEHLLDIIIPNKADMKVARDEVYAEFDINHRKEANWYLQGCEDMAKHIKKSARKLIKKYV